MLVSDIRPEAEIFNERHVTAVMFAFPFYSVNTFSLAHLKSFSFFFFVVMQSLCYEARYYTAGESVIKSSFYLPELLE